MKKLILSLFILLCTTLAVFAQERTVSGTVTDKEGGKPIPGVSVKVRGAKAATQTEANGKFTIKVPASATTLEFSYLGFTTVTRDISGSVRTVDVALESDAQNLSEVTVTSYGLTQTKREIGGSIAKVTGKQFELQPTPSVGAALQGRAAGVVVQNNNGLPGGSISVIIRGLGSFTAGSSPLYIVDGVQMNGATVGGFTQANTLASINPTDIESIEVLKDAASASIYGAQAANGVVLITTKKGKAGATKINAHFYSGVSEVIKKFDVLNTQEFFALRVEALQNANMTSSATAVRNSILASFGLPTTTTDAEIAALPTYNWQDAAFRTGRVQNYELGANGGNEKTTFYLSGSYNTMDAVITKADFKRGTFKSSIEHKVNNKLTLNSNINLSTITQVAPFSTDGSFLGSPAFASSLILPINRITNDDGTFYGLPGSGQPFYGILNQNIIANNEYNISNQTTNTLIGSVSGTYKILPSLSFRSFFSVENRSLTGKNFVDPRTADGYNVSGYGEVYSNWNSNIMTNQTLNFSKVFNTDHKVDALAGFEYRTDRTNTTYGYGNGYPTPQFTNLGAAATPLSATETFTGFKSSSLFAKANYSYKGKYIISGTIRYQGSSRFGSDKQFGFFPGVTAVWNMGDEDFLKANWISNLKLRASYGQTGNDQISNFGSRALYGRSGTYLGQTGIAPSGLPNPALKWEKTTTTDLGIDFGFFKDRLFGSLGVFDKTNSDLLLAQPLISTTGFGSVTSNVGTIQNRGIEVELNSVNVSTASGFKWTTNFNYTYIKNKIKKLYGGLTQLPSDPATRVGWDLGAVFNYRYAGVNPQNGRPAFLDINNNITYSPTAADRVYVGSTLPKHTGGLSNTFSFKGIDLDFLFQYQYGRMQIDGQESFLTENGLRTFNTLREVYERRWTTPGQITDMPRPYNGVAEPTSVIGLNSRLLKKTDYIRLKQINLGYNLPKSLLSKMNIASVKIYAQGTNLFTYDDWGGYDPEFYGASTGITPVSKNYTFGIQVGF
eukprot:GDKK01047618.1.p1 GENE.GDKK01047618.1~~GDKK01047618.1.p1  ORF type:complete len:1010 (-),score=41.22 GDKK01047618.1:1618-4647(-)